MGDINHRQREMDEQSVQDPPPRAETKRKRLRSLYRKGYPYGRKWQGHNAIGHRQRPSDNNIHPSVCL